MFEKFMNFKGTWRTYQQRVLDRYDLYKKDNKFHIVAAPGSGKTTLGIELIRRIDRPALILAPSITIREQWVERIRDAFLIDPALCDLYISQNLKDPRVITVSTYQALHSAMTHYKGEDIEDYDDFKTVEHVDYSNYQIADVFKHNHLGTLCLDECHHLRSEWWKALEDFNKTFPELFTVALTATPPYDSTPAMWERYMKLCGEIDEEITVPELVKDGNLCPHQDYVYFNYPTESETAALNRYEADAHAFLDQMLNDPNLYTAVKGHPFFSNTADPDRLLENPAYLSSMAIFLNAHGDSYADMHKNLLGYKTLEPMSEKWMDLLLQGFLYDDAESYTVDSTYRESLIKEMKARGFIEKKKVCLEMNKAVEKMMIQSLGKCDSIKAIVKHEYQNMGNDLRLLILTDYIRKEYERSLGDDSHNLTKLGVLPFFEHIRRDCQNTGLPIRLGVLCGTIIIIPIEAKEALRSMMDEPDRITFHGAGQLTDYVRVEVRGDNHQITGLISDLFAQGYIHVLIGTKSLLGEGWDSPCINSLILASFVGSYMLSNQMRGRAIRVFRNVPDKTSNIWHLVCVRPKQKLLDSYDDGQSEDFQTLLRRSEHFLGLHYEKDVIENGIDRMSLIKPPFSPGNIKKINQEMLKLSDQRSLLKERWDRSLAVYDKIEIADETEVPENRITAVLFNDALRTFWLTLIGNLIGLFFITILRGLTKSLSLLSIGILLVYGSYFILSILFRTKKVRLYKNPLARLEIFGRGIRQALLETGQLESENSCVEAVNNSNLFAIYLKGGTGHDKRLFAQCVYEFYAPLENQRYILYNPKRKNRNDAYFVIPECFSNRKENAEIFAHCMKTYIGPYETIYTRNTEGRQILLKGRIHSLANKQQRCTTKKTVKGSLE